MSGAGPTNPESAPALRAYLLGTLDVESALALQRRLVYEIAGDPTAAAVILCEHPPGITIGRHGSRAHVRLGPEELTARRWAVRWVARGGGAVLHAPGQVACYPVLPLAAVGRTPGAYVRDLAELVRDLAAGFGLAAGVDHVVPGVRVNGRRVASVGVAVRSGVTSFGLVVNVRPDLELFRLVECDGDAVPMTSLQRECPTPVRPAAVRQRLVELLADRFGLGRLSVFHHHPSSPTQSPRHAEPARHR